MIFSVKPLMLMSMKVTMIAMGMAVPIIRVRRRLPRNRYTTSIASTAPLVFLDVNLRPPWYAIDAVRELVLDAHWLKLNEHELQELAPQRDNVEAQLGWLHEEFAVKNILLTMGEEGAWLSQGEGVAAKVKPEINNQVVDTVGAGDAFSSVMLFGILNDWSLTLCMQRAQSFASEIVKQRGATVSDPGFYKRIIQSWNQ